MIRTQIYLTENEKQALTKLSSKSGKKQSELIREAIDSFITKLSKAKREDFFDKLSGMWADRDESLNAESLRKDWERKW